MIKYKSLSWLEQRWNTRSLMALNENDIRAKGSQVNQVSSENFHIYQVARAERDQRRGEFRGIYPRKDYPSALKSSVPQPPDLAGRWQRLLSRRDAAFRGVQRAKEERKVTFLDRMGKGRVRAMLRRQREIRRMINEVAAELDIELTEHALDKRVAEFLDKLPVTAKEESE